jgi:uncharacterized delta-60 repeat protein
MIRTQPTFARTLLILLTILAARVGSVHAAPGDLDLSFSGDGKVLETSLATGFAAAVAVQADGKIVAVGGAANDFLVVRYIRAGSLDPTFGGDGIVTTSFGSNLSIDDAVAVAVQTDGRIVVAGRAGSASNPQIALARYNTDGALDTTFSGDGILTMEFSIGSSSGGPALGVAVQTDGRIVIVGSNGTDVALARLTTNGTLDATFGPAPGGRATRDFGIDDTATAIAILSDNRIIVAGSMTFNGQKVFVWDRFSSNGFAEGLQGTNPGNGASHTSFGPNTDVRATSMAIQPDGRIVLAGDFTFTGGGGQVPIFTDNGMAIARYNTDGTMDAAFDADGLRTIDFGISAFARAVAIQPDGKLVVAGRATTSGFPIDVALARLHASGALDTSFSGDGLLTTDFSSGGISRNDSGSGLAIQASDGRIVVAGSAGGNPGGGAALVALARYHAFSCNGVNVTLLGTNGPNSITGTTKPDVIHGLGGNDVLSGDPAFGGGSGDIICDGAGNDTLFGGPGNDTLVAQSGADNLNGGEGTNDVCLGNNARLDPLDTFAQCETISSGGAGVSGEWERIVQKCNSSPSCRLDGSLRVFNPGGETTAVASQVAFYLSEDQALDEGDVFLAYEEAGALEAGAETFVKLKTKLPEESDAAGFYVIAVVDFFNDVAEVNEDNNLAVSAPLSIE